MKKDKQIKLLSILLTGRYKVEGNHIMTFRKGQWANLSPTPLPTGYIQYTLFNGRRGKDGVRVIVYHHIITYMATHGLYDEGLVIDHIDGNKDNNVISNLRAITPQHNVNPAKTYKTKRVNANGFKTIRSKEIKAIRELMEQGYSQAHIARILGLNRLSVRYTYNNIKEGKVLKYE